MSQDALIAEINKITDEITLNLNGIRRWMHQHPELAFEEVETSAVIGRELDRMGIPWQGGFGHLRDSRRKWPGHRPARRL